MPKQLYKIMAWQELPLGIWAVAFTLVLLLAPVLSILHPVKWMEHSSWQFVMWPFGSCLNLYEGDYSLNNAPSDYDSVHGVHRTAGISSDFEDDEFVVYKTCQIKIRYVVKFRLAEDQIITFQPVTGMELEQDSSEPEWQCHSQHESYALADANLLNPVRNGLQDRSGNPGPQEGIYIRTRIIRLCRTGPNGKEKLLQLIATLLTLQFIDCTKELKFQNTAETR